MTPLLYWILSLTWGLPMTLAGGFAAIGLLLAGKKGKWTEYGPVFPVTRATGASLGVTVICDREEKLLSHERGHSVQNCIFGPLMIPVISIPSAVRFHFRRRTKKRPLPPYDSIWFEGQATKWGKRLFPKP